MTVRLLSALALLASAALLPAACDQRQAPATRKKYVIISTGDVTGLYFPVGGAISRVMNAANVGATFIVEPSGGSADNINALSDKSCLHVGLAQSDSQSDAWLGRGAWASAGPVRGLRSVLSLHSEAVTLVATVASGVRSPADIRGKKVCLGMPGSGGLANARDILASYGLRAADVHVVAGRPRDMPRMIDAGEVDAFFFTVGHPNPNSTIVAGGTVQTRFIPIQGPEADALLAAKPYYVKTSIPVARLYPGAVHDGPGEVPTIGVKATMVVSDKADAEIVYNLAKTVATSVDRLKMEEPFLDSLSGARLLEGLTAPLHPGAERYFREAGLLK